MLTEVLNWDELQAILLQYDTVFVLGHMKRPLSESALAMFEEYSRKTPGARFLQFDSGTEAGIKMNGKLGIKFCPMLLAFKNGMLVKTYVGGERSKMEAVLNSITTVREMNPDLDWSALVKYPSN